MWWYVYMVVTSVGKLYTGICTNPKKRVYEHNHTKKGAKCLIGQRPIKLVWCSETMSKSQALKIEYMIKQKSKVEKVHIVMGDCLISYEEFEELLWPGEREKDENL